MEEDMDKFSEWYLKILEDAELIDSRYPIKGMLVYRRWGLFIIRQMQQYLERLLEEAGHEPTLFPVLIPDNILGKETEHIAGFEEQVFWVTHAGANELERKLALRPTSETSMYEMFKLWIRSHQDLPLKIHQSCAVYRYETRHTRPLIRGREFLWNEGHSAHIDDEDARKNIEEIKKIYGKLINELLCIPFVVNRRPEWDRFPGAADTFAFDTIMPNGKTLQIATAHNLGQNFSKVFEITYEDEKGEHQYVHQTSYGPSFGRLLAALISIHGDEKGLVLPPEVAPIQCIIIPIFFKESNKDRILEYSEKVRDRLSELGIRTELDAGDERPGNKFYHWEMKGVPLRLEVGPKDLEKKEVTIVRRDTGKKSQIGFKKLSDIPKILEEITKDMRKAAQKEFDRKFLKVKSVDELKKSSGNGILSLGCCMKKGCAEKIEEHVDIISVNDNPAKCTVCGKSGKAVNAANTY